MVFKSEKQINYASETFPALIFLFFLCSAAGIILFLRSTYFLEYLTALNDNKAHPCMWE